MVAVGVVKLMRRSKSPLPMVSVSEIPRHNTDIGSKRGVPRLLEGVGQFSFGIQRYGLDQRLTHSAGGPGDSDARHGCVSSRMSF